MGDEKQVPGADPTQGSNQGTPGAEGALQGGPNQPGDVVTTQQLEAVRQRYEQDMAKLRSSLDRRYAGDKQAWDQEKSEYQSRIDQLLTSTMDDDERKAYELERYRDERDHLVEEANRYRAEAEARSSMMEYAKWFNQLGVPFEKMDFTDPETMMQSAWTGLQEGMTSMRDKVKDLETRLQQLQNPPAQEQGQQGQQGQQGSGVQVRQQAGQTFTGKGAVSSPGDVLDVVRESLKERFGREVSLEETFQAIESGRVDINELLKSHNA